MRAPSNLPGPPTCSSRRRLLASSPQPLRCAGASTKLRSSIVGWNFDVAVLHLSVVSADAAGAAHRHEEKEDDLERRADNAPWSRLNSKADMRHGEDPVAKMTQQNPRADSAATSGTRRARRGPRVYRLPATAALPCCQASAGFLSCGSLRLWVAAGRTYHFNPRR
jgi:hypothetical protein